MATPPRPRRTGVLQQVSATGVTVPLHPEDARHPQRDPRERDEERDEKELGDQEGQRARDRFCSTGMSGFCASITKTVSPVGGLMRPIVHMTVTKMPNQIRRNRGC